jgi:hypothetical protein
VLQLPQWDCVEVRSTHLLSQDVVVAGQVRHANGAVADIETSGQYEAVLPYSG